MSILDAFGKVCDTKTAAEDVYLTPFVEEVNLAHRQGRKPFVDMRAGAMLFEDLLSQFLKTVRKVAEVEHIESSPQRSKYRLLLKEFGALPVTAFEGGKGGRGELTIAEAQGRWEATRGPAGINGLLRELRVVLKWAEVQGHLAKQPFGKYKVTLLTERHRERRFVDGELDLLFAAATKMDTAHFLHSGAKMRERIKFTVETAARMSEMQNFQREDIDYVNGKVRFPATKMLRVFNRKTKAFEEREVWNTKNRKTRWVPMTMTLRQVLEPYRLTTPKYFIFGEQGAHVQRFVVSWNTLNLMAHGKPHVRDKRTGRDAAQKAALRSINLHWHDLRHEAISRWAESGQFPDTQLKELAGHANFSTTLRYVQAASGKLAANMAAFDAARG
jgi:integrase